MKFLSVEEVIELHDYMLEKHGGLNGIRSKDLLISAVETPKATMFGEFLHKTVYDMAAAYLFHLVQNHPFNDGNKRTGAGSALLFLEINKMPILFEDADYEELVVEVAKGNRQKVEIAAFFQTGEFSAIRDLTP